MFLECMDYQHLTKDRSLGSVELEVSELAAASEEDPTYPFKSLGVIQKAQPLRLDGSSYKGELHYSAEFIPAMHLKGVSFGKPKNQIQKALDGGEGYVSDEDAGSSSDEEYQKVPEGVTIRHDRSETSLNKVPPASPLSPNGNGVSPTTPKPKPKGSDSGDSGLEMSKDDILKTRKSFF